MAAAVEPMLGALRRPFACIAAAAAAAAAVGTGSPAVAQNMASDAAEQQFSADMKGVWAEQCCAAVAVAAASLPAAPACLPVQPVARQRRVSHVQCCCKPATASRRVVYLAKIMLLCDALMHFSVRMKANDTLLEIMP